MSTADAAKQGEGGDAAAARAPRQIIVMRHGQTVSNAQGIWQGHLDHELSELGHIQAAKAAAALVSHHPVRVVASDLQRARVTGQDVAHACGVELEIDPRWREIHAGGWQGLTGDQVRERYPEDMERLISGEDFRRGGDGESVADVALRTGEAIRELAHDLAPGECAIVATHGVAARAAAAELVGMDQRLAWRVLGGLGNAAWAVLEEGRAGWRIVTWNASAGELHGRF
ncbi:histidine phosphatase family protein [Janibacter sp. GXQ6167]|uniref:histidine phosphatase family protein n=1 Tax=Janibacter sp. GXQ6167 TaxID=3240791 RepID=UPI0035262F64